MYLSIEEKIETIQKLQKEILDELTLKLNSFKQKFNEVFDIDSENNFILFDTHIYNIQHEIHDFVIEIKISKKTKTDVLSYSGINKETLLTPYFRFHYFLRDSKVEVAYKKQTDCFVSDYVYFKTKETLESI